jgi:hypothetical protein
MTLNPPDGISMTDSSKDRPRSALAGNRLPQPHRFHLTDGRVMTGYLFRSPGSRLADHLGGIKGYISVVDAVVGPHEEPMKYVALNSSHVVFIEEIPAPEEEPTGTGPEPV